MDLNFGYHSCIWHLFTSSSFILLKETLTINHHKIIKVQTININIKLKVRVA
ncbi:hypothetical protein PanWU01x14_071260 [Parasponia andersonii]|uniref:Uncharacterized protein n=1 Tax=Parasponia andersonii TaxID=3476 RepID=A0A2P5DEE4_PARAD|nr:hypothetical protein PanWU01x14_071260 [Parasponia andersonii]